MHNDISKYYRIISPSDIKISRDDIFYRDKFNDIINYLKVMLTNHEESIIQQYIEPKGKLLINISPGTDIIDFLKLISKNYYLDFLELDYEEILKNPDNFYENFSFILKNVVEDKKSISEKKINAEKSEELIREDKISRLLLINQHELSIKLFEEKQLLKTFLISQKSSENNINYIDKGIILIWINKNFHEIKENSRDVFQIFDMFVKIPLLNKIERETILRNFSEKNPKIVFNIDKIVEVTHNWEIKDITQLLKVAIFKHFLNADLNDKSNEITDILIDLIESDEFIPSILNKENKKEINSSERNKDRDVSRSFNSVEKVVNEIQTESISEFMLNQLYENAVSNNYTELLIIIDKLDKNIFLEEIDKKIIAKYPFILNDSPNKARINLEKAKKRIDNIMRAFEKKI